MTRQLKSIIFPSLLLCALHGCTPRPPEPPRPVQHISTVQAPRQSDVTFTDISQQAGISFQHINGAAGKKNMPETVGSGVAFLDYDNDGWEDILLVNSTTWPGAPP